MAKNCSSHFFLTIPMQAISGTPLATPVGFAAFPNELFKVNLIMMMMVMIMMMKMMMIKKSNLSFMILVNRCRITKQHLSNPNKTIPNSQQFLAQPNQSSNFILTKPESRPIPFIMHQTKTQQHA